MKKFIALVCCLFLVNNFYAQTIKTQQELELESAVAVNQNKNVAALTNLDKSRASVKTVGVNATYMNSSVFTDNATFVKILQQRAAKYDLKNTEVYNPGDKSTYAVVFDTKKGVMSVTYNDDGKITASKERYKNVALPRPVIVSIMKAYPEWRFDGNVCSIDYKDNKGLLTSYKVKISNGTQTKTVKSDAKGNII
ncbi:hypothetical protein [Formosa sp. PL04]|uniref:hypothetical protein n=1 Tax=Formosa sp. PL04 TaxID=3081755 RepID=UPI0029826B85|nr:hypothetical protein [Formosa sp. PL04]MDW5287605.1 hypothetical protein [Formosa sp. PL04]